jgi:hypothetical protein
MRKFNMPVMAMTVALGLSLAVNRSAQAATVGLNPAATYLHTLNLNSVPNTTPNPSADGAPNSTPVDLAALGINPGDHILLTRLGDYQASGAANLANDTQLSLVAVFSSTNVISSDHTLLNRIPGAIDAGVDFVTNNNAVSGESTDIPEDFLVASGNGLQTGVQIVVPTGGAFLFFTVADSYWADNKDPDGDFGVSIIAVPEPASAALMSIGMLALVRRRK